jgi:hypothetical protein
VERICDRIAVADHGKSGAVRHAGGDPAKAAARQVARGIFLEAGHGNVLSRAQRSPVFLTGAEVDAPRS